MADNTTTYKNKARLYSILLTLLISSGLLLVLLFIILHTPIPPYPEGGGGTGSGIELNLGFTDEGMGNNQAELPAAVKEPEPEPKDDDQVLTQDVEDAPAISDPIKKPTKKVEEKPIKKEPEKPKQVVNTKALYPSRSNQASSEGSQNKAGDQGSPEGNLGAKVFGNGGQGGSGGGTGGGTGTGTGTGVGSGISYNLDGRTHYSLPNPKYDSQSEGLVVVEIIVDKEGRVTQATAGKKGTTTTDTHLWEAAQKAALQAKFDRKPDAPAFQKGTINYRFRLQ